MRAHPAILDRELAGIAEYRMGLHLSDQYLLSGGPRSPEPRAFRQLSAHVRWSMAPAHRHAEEHHFASSRRSHAAFEHPAARPRRRTPTRRLRWVYLGHWLGDIHQPLHSSFQGRSGRQRAGLHPDYAQIISIRPGTLASCKAGLLPGAARSKMFAQWRRRGAQRSPTSNGRNGFRPLHGNGLRDPTS